MACGALLVPCGLGLPLSQLMGDLGWPPSAWGDSKLTGGCLGGGLVCFEGDLGWVTGG